MPELTVDQAFELAVGHHQAGRLQEAESLYRQVLARQPKHVDALQYFGVLASQAGRPDVAVDLIRQSVALDPNRPQALNNLGNALVHSGRYVEAIAACRRAIALSPDLSEAHINLGNALKGNGQLNEAIAAYRQAIALKPDHPQAHSNLGNALAEVGLMDEAIAACREAIALSPCFPEAHNNLGHALKGNGQLDEAITAFRQAVTLRPNYPEGLSNLGNALTAKGQLDQAIAALHQAIALRPDFPEAHSNLGNALKDKGQLDQAIAAYRQALVLRPNYPEAHSNLGAALADMGLVDEAIDAYQQAIALRPNFADVHQNLAYALRDKGQPDQAIAVLHQAIALRPDFLEAHSNLGTVLKDKGQLDQAIAAYRRAIALGPSFVEADSNLVYSIHFHAGFDAPAIAEEHKRWNRQHAQPLAQFIQPHSNDRTPQRRLRIGYVSPDFRYHVVASFLLPLLAHHDKSQVEVFAYAQVQRPDAMTEQLRSFTDQWRSTLGLSDEQVADLVRQDRIDILVDLAMHMAHNRLLVFARKPAPVQVTYLAYCSTTGLQTIDYRLSDPYLDPVGEDDSVYSEKTIRLPDTYWCYQPPTATPEVGPLPALERGSITFGCLNNFVKVSEPTLAAWAKLLLAMPGSRLLLHAHEGSHRQRVHEWMAREGIEPQRLQFAGSVAFWKYLEQYHQIDVALDPFPYGGGTTTCDALWMGVPVVSLAGRTAVGRGGLSLLSNIGLPELVARSEEEYVRLATDLANDLPRLSTLRSTLRQRMQLSPLMDAPRFARNVEAAYRQMWRRWCEENSPQ